MTPWGVRCELPVEPLGRLRLPIKRMRFRDGYVRLGWNADRTAVVCTLVDREDHVLPARDQITAYERSYRMGVAVEYWLARHNRYQAGERTGRRDQVLVAT